MAADDARPGQSSRYLDYLPAVFQQDAEVGQPNFLGRFLLAFEHMLTGLGDADEPGLEEKLDGVFHPDTGAPLLAGLHRYFDPGPGSPERERAPAEFLEWLAGWVALTMREDLDEPRRREFIASAVSLYRLRGTKKGIEEAVRIYTRLAPTINELNTSFRVGVNSTIGEDTLLGGGAPNYFRVLIRLPTPDPEQLRKHLQVVAAIVDMEKPAHTYYNRMDIDVEIPTMQINVHSTIGVDTLLGL